MASQTLFIDIYSFNLRKIKESREVTTPSGATGTRHTTETENVMFEQLFNSLNGKDYEAKFNSFISDFVGRFNSQYVVSRGKGISMHPNHKVVINHKKFYIWGEFSGGHTGREQRVFNRDDSTSSDYTISKEKMVASPFFFLIWLPRDSNMGLLILHRYSNLNCDTEFKNAVSKYFIAKGYKPVWAAYVPREICKKYLETCALTAVRVQHSAPNQKTFEGTVFEDFSSDKGVTFTTSLVGLSLSFAKLLKTGKFAEDFQGFIKVIDQNYEDGDPVSITYKNTNGITVKASLEHFDEIMPKIALDADCFDEATNTPNLDKISVTAIDFLESIKKEIGYTKQLEP